MRSENGLHQFLNAALHIGVVGNRASNRNVAGAVGRPITDDPDMQRSIQELVKAIF